MARNSKEEEMDGGRRRRVLRVKKDIMEGHQELSREGHEEGTFPMRGTRV